MMGVGAFRCVTGARSRVGRLLTSSLFRGNVRSGRVVVGREGSVVHCGYGGRAGHQLRGPRRFIRTRACLGLVCRCGCPTAGVSIGRSIRVNSRAQRTSVLICGSSRGGVLVIIRYGRRGVGRHRFRVTISRTCDCTRTSTTQCI